MNYSIPFAILFKKATSTSQSIQPLPFLGEGARTFKFVTQTTQHNANIHGKCAMCIIYSKKQYLSKLWKIFFAYNNPHIYTSIIKNILSQILPQNLTG